MKPERQWYKFQNEAREGDEVADLYVYDVIGDSWDGESTTAKRFIADVQALPKSVGKITLHINSPGGSVFDAVAIANVLRGHRAAVAVSIEGLAASAATVVAMGGSKINIAENALFMIHDPYGFAMGGAKDMRATADALDRVRDAIVATYQWHSHLEAAELGELMAETTWMTAAEAVERGFAHEVTGATDARAQMDPDVFDKLGPVPERFREAFARVASVKVEPPPIDAAAARGQSSPPIIEKPQTRGADEMTDEEIKALVDKTRAEAHEAGRTEELARILGIEAALIPGHEKLVASLKRDPAITPGEAALRINAAERNAIERSLEGIKRDGQTTEAVTAQVSETGDSAGVDDSNRPLEERAKRIWDNSPAVRAEFKSMGGFASYLAFRQAEEDGAARVLHAVK